LASKKNQCKRCGKYSHWVRDCHIKLKVEAHVTQAEEDSEPAMLMAHTTVFPKSSPPSHARDFEIPPECRPLCIIEEQVFV
jgi:hypothetical protein